jgi:hypothetical protein
MVGGRVYRLVNKSQKDEAITAIISTIQGTSFNALSMQNTPQAIRNTIFDTQTIRDIILQAFTFCMSYLNFLLPTFITTLGRIKACNIPCFPQ